MGNHHKPSREELKAGMDSSLKQLEKIPNEGEPPVVETPVVPPVNPETPVVETPPVVEPVVETPVVPPITETAEEKIARLEKEAAEAKREADEAKQKFSNSSREAQVLGFKEKELAKAQEAADELPDPTDDEMKALYPNWDEIDTLTKDLAKDRVLNKKKQDLIAAARAKFKDAQDWNEKVETFIQDPAVLANHPALEGKQDAFKAFAAKKSSQGVDFEVLVLAFTGELAKTKLPPKKGQMFEQGSGGPATPPKPKDDKISLAESEAIRVTDYKKYVQLLKAGKIATS